MTVSMNDLSGMTVLIIDVPEKAAEIEAAFVSAGASNIIIVSDMYDSRKLDEAFVPDIAVVDAGIIEDYPTKALAFRLAGDSSCVYIIYDAQLLEENYGRGDSVHKSKPISDVVAAAISGIGTHLRKSEIP